MVSAYEVSDAAILYPEVDIISSLSVVTEILLLIEVFEPSRADEVEFV